MRIGVEKPRYVHPGLGRLWERLDPLAYLALRATAGFIFVVHGLARLRIINIGGPTIESTGQFMARFGLNPPLFWSWYVTALELVGGVLLFIGLFTRPVAALFVGFLAVATFYVTASFGFWAREGGFEYSLALLAMVIVFLVHGGGRYSLDRMVGREI